MALTKEEKQEILDEYGLNEGDTGSPEAQIALLTSRIQKLTQHLQGNEQDHSSRRSLMQMVGKRRRLLNYLIKNDIDRYRNLISNLGLRK
ncbi:MAG: 30S ribosomal protein S15 [Candidatus Marinimicrobia bacterium]|nr:30S ribosomal protein S15 [Candidatus Neomarinimicrobiota bacterium]